MVSVRIHFYCTAGGINRDSPVMHESQPGTNAPVRQPNFPAGPAGSINVTGSTNSWLHPLLVKLVLAHAKDDYLGSRLTNAEARLKDYISVIQTCKSDPSQWASLDPIPQFELEQMYNEMQILLQRIANGLDYFGNPAGWVPMLSFEVNTTLFDNEVDRAIDMLYLAYWINNKASNEQQQVAALTTARYKLTNELAQAKRDFNVAANQLPTLKNKALSLQNQVITTQLEMQAREQELLEQTGDPTWLSGLRMGLKFSAMICQMVPVYQPALGGVGEGLRLGSSPNSPRLPT